MNDEIITERAESSRYNLLEKEIQSLYPKLVTSYRGELNNTIQDCLRSFRGYFDGLDFKNVLSGSADIIKEIYSAISSDAFPYNKIEIVDLNMVQSRYFEYLEGLAEFCMTTISLDEDVVPIKSISDRISDVYQKDARFIESLFSEVDNEGNINDGMKVVESIIWFDDMKDELYSRINNIFTKLADSCKSNKDDVKLMREKCKCTIFSCLSMALFSQLVFNTIINVFEDIKSSIVTREPAIKEEIPMKIF